MKRSFALVFLFFAAVAGAQKVNPNTQVAWPATCATGVYVPATNTCVPAGTAANPAPGTSTLQMNAGGVFGPVNNSFVDTLGNVTLLAMAASLNAVLFVKAPPYNALCDGSTDDRGPVDGSGNPTSAAGLQRAFSDAKPGSTNPLCTRNGCSIQFPAGTCVTSTIKWEGQPFFGSGISSTIIKGKAGQDVFRTVDGTFTAPAAGTLVHDLRIMVDNSVDASSAPQGNGTIPNRVVGTAGGLTPISPAISPGPWVFGTAPNGVNSNCSGTIAAGSLGTITFSGPFCAATNSYSLTAIDSWRVVGAPITVNGVGASGANLVTTIASVTGPLTVTLTVPATTAGAGLSGTMLAPVTPPWYCGNAGFAFPNSNGSTPSPNLTFWTFQNVSIISTGGPLSGNHSCGMFVQAPPYGLRAEKMVIQGFWVGYGEAKPYTNPNGGTWTGDTASYRNIEFYYNVIPLVLMQGNHRVLANINIYGGAQFQTTGPWWLEASSSATIDRMYYECSNNSGENERWTGSGNGFVINGGSLDQCLPIPQVNWLASNSQVNAQIAYLQIGAGAIYNKFLHTSLLPQFTSDSGFQNSVESNNGAAANMQRSAYFNRPQTSAGTLDSSYLISGNSTTPYINSADLTMTCADLSIMSSATTVAGTCVPDPTGSELTLKYFQSAGPTTITDGLNNGGVGNTWTVFPRLFGTSIPRARVLVTVEAQAVGAGAVFSTTFLVKDGTASNLTLATGTMTFGSTWTKQSMIADLSTATAGNVLSFRIQPVSNTGTNYQIASIAISPIPVDFILKGTASLTTAAIAAGQCGTTVTVPATGVSTLNTIRYSYAATITANPGTLIVNAWPSVNNVNFNFCNPTTASVTPSSAVLNWEVSR